MAIQRNIHWNVCLFIILFLLIWAYYIFVWICPCVRSTYCVSFVFQDIMKTIQIPIFSQYNWLIGLVGRVFANDPEDLGSIPGRVIPKTLKMVLDTSLLNTQQYKVRIKGEGAIQGSSYWKGSLLVALDYSLQLIFSQY